MLNPQSNPNSFDPGPLLLALRALKKGNFSTRMPEGSTAIDREIARAFNDVAQLNAGLSHELDSVSKAVKTDRKTTRRAKLRGASGSWAKSLGSINAIVDKVVPQVPKQTPVATAGLRDID